MADVTEMARQRATLAPRARSVKGKGAGTPSKYKAVRTTVNARIFDSKAEARRYQELLVMGAAGWIRDLELQPSFPIIVCGVKVGTYRADFRYDELCSLCCETTDGRPALAVRNVIEDVKSEPTKTPVYRLKKKLVEAIYGIRIIEVK